MVAVEAGLLDCGDDDDDDEEDDIRWGFPGVLATSAGKSAADEEASLADVSTDVEGMIFFNSLEICSHSPISDGGG